MHHGLSDPRTQVPHHGPPTDCGRPEGGARTWLPRLAACKHYIVIIIIIIIIVIIIITITIIIITIIIIIIIIIIFTIKSLIFLLMLVSWVM